MNTAGLSPAVVVIAFDRTHTLARLFRSLGAARYPSRDASGHGTPLIISIDHSESPEVLRLAEEFHWPFGSKEIIRHETRLGLREHVLRCGDLALKHGAVIVLEDDLTVAPGFHDYACQALEFYAGDDSVAGLSLYNYHLHPFAAAPGCDVRFDPLHDGHDNWFGCFASSWGQCWTAAQWSGFRAWLEKRPAHAVASTKLPACVRNWPATSWKKLFHEYQIETARYFVFPRVALSTNWGDAGTHLRGDTVRFQAPLLCGEMRWRFSRLAESRSIYDAHMEIEPRCLQAIIPALRTVSFDVDLMALKEPPTVSAPFVLTLRAAQPAVWTFGLALHPPELNVIHDVPGDALKLVAREHWLAACERPLPAATGQDSNITARNRIDQAQASGLAESIHVTRRRQHRRQRRSRWAPLARLSQWFASWL